MTSAQTVLDLLNFIQKQLSDANNYGGAEAVELFGPKGSLAKFECPEVIEHPWRVHIAREIERISDADAMPRGGRRRYVVQVTFCEANIDAVRKVFYQGPTGSTAALPIPNSG